MVRSQHTLITGFNVKLAAIAALVVLLSLVGCTSSPPPKARASLTAQGPASVGFKGTEHVDNSLVGRFWSPVSEEYLSWSEVARFMPRGGWLMVGEQHDHPDHHSVQTFLISYLASHGVLGHVAMEMVSVDQQYAIDNRGKAVAKLQAKDLDWPEKGWPWPRYEEQIKAAMRLSNGLVAGDLSDLQKQNVRDAGGAIAHYSTEHSQYLAELIEASHCGMFSAEQAMPMVDMQIARDQLMTQQLIAYALPNKVGVFIAGAGHVRADYGVPLWVADDVSVRTLLLIGVSESENPADYVQDTFNGQPAAQLVFFVPGIKQVDYCAQFRS